MTDKIKSLVEKYYDKGVTIRHAIHMYPELALEEEKTATLIEETLNEIGIPNHRLSKTGVVGLIKGGMEGKTVLLRADIDALEVTEEADVPYKSTRPGFMHACGHDGHAAGLLLAAMVLNEIKDDIKGNIKLMFQPAEESVGGAEPMIREGILENPKVDAAFGCHLWGGTKRGQAMVKNGAMMASPDSFDIRVIGKGGHGALPHLAIDPIVMSAQIINNFQSVISRRRNPVDPAVVSVCTINSGDNTYNVIPNDAKMRGTIRTFSPELRASIPKMLEEVVKSVTESFGGSYEFKVEERFPPLINDEGATELVKASLAKIIGSDNVVTSTEPNMGAEDFAYLTQKVPGSYYMVGIAETDEPVLHHHPKFQWDDEVLKISSASLCQVAIDFLNNN